MRGFGLVSDMGLSFDFGDNMAGGFRVRVPRLRLQCSVRSYGIVCERSSASGYCTGPDGLMLSGWFVDGGLTGVFMLGTSALSGWL